MATFKTIRSELTLELTVRTAAKVTSFRGTPFVPNHCEALVIDGQIITVTLERRDDDGWTVPDPAGDDAVLSVSYAGSEISAEGRGKLPKVAQEALAEIEGAIR